MQFAEHAVRNGWYNFIVLQAAPDKYMLSTGEPEEGNAGVRKSLKGSMDKFAKKIGQYSSAHYGEWAERNCEPGEFLQPCFTKQYIALSAAVSAGK